MTDAPDSIHPSAEAILKYFSYDHLPAPLQAVSKPLSDLAYKMVEETAPGPEQTTGLRKLLESKDCFVRAAIVDFDPKAALERLNELKAVSDHEHKPIRILITGSRDFNDYDLMCDAIQAEAGYLIGDMTTIAHGGARGADLLADQIAYNYRCNVEPHVADWDRYGKAAGPLRNAEMVNLGADVCLAFPIGKSRGTRGCIKLAEAAGIPVRVFES